MQHRSKAYPVIGSNAMQTEPATPTARIIAFPGTCEQDLRTQALGADRSKDRHAFADGSDIQTPGRVTLADSLKGCGPRYLSPRESATLVALFGVVCIVASLL